MVLHGFATKSNPLTAQAAALQKQMIEHHVDANSQLLTLFLGSCLVMNVGEPSCSTHLVTKPLAPESSRSERSLDPSCMDAVGLTKKTAVR